MNWQWTEEAFYVSSSIVFNDGKNYLEAVFLSLLE